MSSNDCKKAVPYQNSNIFVRNNDQKCLNGSLQAIQCSTLSLHIAAYENSFKEGSQNVLFNDFLLFEKLLFFIFLHKTN